MLGNCVCAFRRHSTFSPSLIFCLTFPLLPSLLWNQLLKQCKEEMLYRIYTKFPFFSCISISCYILLHSGRIFAVFFFFYFLLISVVFRNRECSTLYNRFLTYNRIKNGFIPHIYIEPKLNSKRLAGMGGDIMLGK